MKGAMRIAEDNEAGLLETHDHFRAPIGNELAKRAGLRKELEKVVIVPAYNGPLSLSR
jgi:hypothetical protein